jgi:hypothetical protein
MSLEVMTMSLFTVEGVYENGQVKLAEKPAGVDRARVTVTFLPEDENDARLKRQAAGKRLLQDMKRGLSFGGIKFDRDEIYEERMDELDRRRSRKA